MTESVARTSANEALQSETLKQLICKAIVAKEGLGPHQGKCTGFTYLVTEFARSTRYGYLDESRPITMQMKVAVTNPVSNDTYDAVLTRALSDDFDLKFKASIAQTNLQLAHGFIREFADEVGEYADWWELEQAGAIKAVTYGALPLYIQQAFTKKLADHNAYLNPYPGEPNTEHGEAFFSEEYGFVEILKDGSVVGYVLNIDEYIDHPLWDGSGIHVYFDSWGTVIESVEWSA